MEVLGVLGKQMDNLSLCPPFEPSPHLPIFSFFKVNLRDKEHC